MPLYEYECLSCGKRFEVIQKFSDAPESECPSCEGEVRRLLSPPAFQFKGSGWYVTDYAKSGEKSKKDDGGKSESKAESKKASSSKESSSDKKTAEAAGD